MRVASFFLPRLKIPVKVLHISPNVSTFAA
jgi:hypothetical protein